MKGVVRHAMSDSQLKTMGQQQSSLHPVNSPVVTVVQDLGFGRYELQQFREPDSVIVESSADLMRAEKSPSAADRKEAKLQAVRALQNNTEYEVEAVTGERGVLTKGTKEYQVKWKTYSEKTWEPAESFDSKSKPLQEYKKRKKAQARTAAAVTTLTADLLATPAETLSRTYVLRQESRNQIYCLCTQGCHVNHTQQQGAPTKIVICTRLCMDTTTD